MTNKEKRHYKELNDTIDLITDIKNYALIYGDSVFDSISRCHKTQKYNSLDFITDFICISDSNSNTPETWKTAVINSKSSLYQWERDVVIHFVEDICVSSRQTLTDCFDKAINDLNQFKENAHEKKKKTEQTGVIFAVSTGVMIALLVI